MTNSINNWLIISWGHIDHLDDAFGRVLASVRGTEEEAKIEARRFIPNYGPIGIVREIE